MMEQFIQAVQRHPCLGANNVSTDKNAESFDNKQCSHFTKVPSHSDEGWILTPSPLLEKMSDLERTPKPKQNWNYKDEMLELKCVVKKSQMEAKEMLEQTR